MNDVRIKFETKARLCIALGLLNNSIESPLIQLNKLRNEMAHNLWDLVEGSAVKNFTDSIKPSILNYYFILGLKIPEVESDLQKALFFFMDVFVPTDIARDNTASRDFSKASIN